MHSATLPPSSRVVALEDASNWLQSAVVVLANGDLPAAVHDCYVGIEHAQDALGQLIARLDQEAARR